MTPITTQRQDADYSSDGQLSDFLDAEKTQKKKKGHTIETLEKDSEDEALEKLVLTHSKKAWVDNLLSQSHGIDATKGAIATGKQINAPRDQDDDEEEDDLEALDEANLFAVDTVKTSRSYTLADPSDNSFNGIPDSPVWHDSDDDRLTISLATNRIMRKLRKYEGEDIISGREYALRLGEHYKSLHVQPQWAQVAIARALGKKKGDENAERPKNRRRSSAWSHDHDEDFSDDEDETDPSTLPLSEFLRDIRNFQPSQAKRRHLRPETLDIQRSRDIPEHHCEKVTALQFHPSLPSILMSASKSTLLRLHKIDPAAHPTPNPTITTIQLARTPIKRACFSGVDGGNITIAGRRRYIHTWNLTSGKVTKTSQIAGDITKLEHRTFEWFRASPCGRYIAILGTLKRGGGTINILSSVSMMPAAEARLNSRDGVADFMWWRNGEGLTVLGRNGGVGEYSLSQQMFVTTWTDQGNIGGTVLGLGGKGGPDLLGTDRWLAIGSKSGIVNVYDRKTLYSKVSMTGEGEISVEMENSGRPEPRKTLEQLVTKVTTTEFSPDGELLVVASVERKDALRVVHLPTCTVYRNWPTEQTPLGRITAVAISGERHLAIGNDTGKIRIWDIRK